MSTLTRVLVLTLSLGGAIAAMAVPNFLGPTGMLLTPNAEALNTSQYNAFVYHFEDADSLEYGFNYGVMDNVEVGFTRLASDETIINAKYNFQQEVPGKPGLAVGVMDLTDSVNLTLYAVAGKHFNIGDLYGVSNFQATIGLAGGSDSNSSLSGLFGGFSFNVGEPGTLMAEFDGNNFNWGGRYAFTKEIVAQAGFAGEDNDFIFGASYNSEF